jgi:Ion channel
MPGFALAPSRKGAAATERPEMDPAARERRRKAWLGRGERIRDAFGLVLVSVLLTYVLASLLANRGWGSVILCTATSATSVIALSSAHARVAAIRTALWLSAATILLAAIGEISDSRIWLNFATVIQVGLLTLAMGAVLRRVVMGERVGSRTILGALSVYAVLGILFTFVYGFVDRVQGTPFFEGHPHPGGSDFLFFSYTTLTTTGYGNLVPAVQPGRMIAGLEMMLGQIFLVTLVAGLVSLWRPGEGIKRRQDERRGRRTAGEPPTARP